MPEAARILLVEDLPTDAELTERELRRAGLEITVVRVETEEEFRRRLREFAPDVVLSDFKLPTFDGLAAVRIAREFDPLLPVIIVTGSMNEDTAVECMKAGAVDYVIKEHLARLGPAIVSALARRREREELERQRRLVEAIFDATSDAIFVKDREGRYLLANRAVEELLGRPREEILARTDAQLMPPDQARRIMDKDREILGGRDLGTDEETLLHPDGSSRIFQATTGALRGREGHVTGLFGIARDVTASREAERRLRELSYAVENSPATVLVTDRDGAITYVNHRFTEVTGYTPEEVLGQNPRLLKSGETPPAVYRELWRVISSGGTWHGELHNRRKNGELFWEAAAITGLRDAGGRIAQYIAIKEDITLRRHLESQLRQSQKLEGIGQLAGGVAHDFNNILNVIMGYGDLALNRLEGSHPVRRYIEEMRKASDRAAGLTRQLLAFSRKQVLKPRIIDLNQVIRDLETMLRRLITENIEIALDLDPGVEPLLLDVGQVEQVLMNLCVNARDAMPGTGRITIATRPRILGALDPVPGPGARPGRFMELSISDTGEGIDPAIRERIFEPFFTTKELGRGTGLGLATVYGIVKQSGGFINVDSTVGVGTRFEILFPVPEDAARSGPDLEMEPESAIQAGTETVLIVEDDPALRAVCVDALGALGYRTLTAADGDRAVAMIRDGTATPDLLLTDVIMPGMSGRETVEAILRLRPACRVLYMSGYPANIIASHGVLDPDVDLLQKPFRPAELARAVRRILDRGEAP